MSDVDDALKSLRERLAGSGEDRLGRALSDLLENPLFTGAVTCAFDARELAVHAQEMAMTALNIPSAADIERLTRRLRSMSQRMEGVEDALYRMEALLAGGAVDARLSSIEGQLSALMSRLGAAPAPRAQPPEPSARSISPRTPRPAAGRAVEPAETPAPSQTPAPAETPKPAATGSPSETPSRTEPPVSTQSVAPAGDASEEPAPRPPRAARPPKAKKA